MGVSPQQPPAMPPLVCLPQVVEHLFPTLLRCQPQQDFMEENAELFRQGKGAYREAPPLLG